MAHNAENDAPDYQLLYEATLRNIERMAREPARVRMPSEIRRLDAQALGWADDPGPRGRERMHRHGPGMTCWCGNLAPPLGDASRQRMLTTKPKATYRARPEDLRECVIPPGSTEAPAR